MAYAEQTLFRALDRPLSNQQVSAASRLSSHGVVTSTSARYSYYYGGSFSGDEKVLLTTGGFDAMLWEDSVGSCVLCFSLPKPVVEWSELQLCLSDDDMLPIELYAREVEDRILLYFHSYVEVGETRWLEESTSALDELTPLREAILNGDYRCLYLAWLKNRSLLEMMEEEEEFLDYPAPPLPAGLGDSTPSLEAFCRLFDIYEDEIEDAVQASPALATVDYAQLIAHLPKDEMRSFLLDLLNDRPNVKQALRRRLLARKS